MIAALRHRRFRAAFVWLALAAVLFRGFLPAGYMPVHAEGSPAGIRLALCSGGVLVPGEAPLHETDRSHGECPFALSAMAAIPPAAAAIPTEFEPSPDAAVPAVRLPTAALLHSRPPARAPPMLS